jgi:hypothetical protein
MLVIGKEEINIALYRRHCSGFRSKESATTEAHHALKLICQNKGHQVAEALPAQVQQEYTSGEKKNGEEELGVYVFMA